MANQKPSQRRLRRATWRATAEQKAATPAVIVHRRRDREGAGIKIAMADIVALLANAPEQGFQTLRVDDGRGSIGGQRRGKDRLPDPVGRKGEHQPLPAAGMERALPAPLGLWTGRFRPL